MYEDSVILFSTDNGGGVADSDSNLPLRGHKESLYEGGVRGLGLLAGGVLPHHQHSQQSDQSVRL